jgi:hypothetical protein
MTKLYSLDSVFSTVHDSHSSHLQMNDEHAMLRSQLEQLILHPSENTIQRILALSQLENYKQSPE